MVSLIVWKDYNCQNWKFMGNYDMTSSTFTSQQKAQVTTQVNKLTEAKMLSDIWGTARDFMTGLQEPESAFYAGGYSIIMSQGGLVYVYGRICRVGDKYLNSIIQYDQLISGSMVGSFYLFQTRSGL